MYAKAAAVKADCWAVKDTVLECCEHFIELKEPVLSPTTIQGYRVIVRNRIQGTKLASVTLDNVTNVKLQSWVSEMTRRGLSPKSIKNAAGFLSAVFEMYRPDFHMKVTKPSVEEPEYRMPSREDIEALLDASTDDINLHLCIALAAFGTLRRSEVFGLSAEDVDREAGTITVRRALVKAGSGWVLKKPKTKRSTRTIRIPMAIIDQMPTEGMIIPESPSTLEHRWYAVLKRTGVSCRFHDLRAFSASIMVVSGCSKLTVRQRGGWSSDVAERVYTRAIPGVAEEETEQLMETFKAFNL